MYVLGNGQLGNMLLEAGRRIGVDVITMSIDDDIVMPADVKITAEREHWQPSGFISKIIGHSGWQNPRTSFSTPRLGKVLDCVLRADFGQNWRLDVAQRPASGTVNSPAFATPA